MQIITSPKNQTYNKINESSKRNKDTCICGSNAPIAMLSVMAFFVNVAQLTANPLAIMANTMPV